MRNLKSFAMIAALALGNVAFAVTDTTSLSITNNSIDTIDAGVVPAFTWAVGDDTTLTEESTLAWTTPASGNGDRSITVSIDEGTTNVVLKLAATVISAAGTGTSAATALAPLTLLTTAQDLITGIDAYTAGGADLTYTAEVDAGGFKTDAAIIVTFTMTSGS